MSIFVDDRYPSRVIDDSVEDCLLVLVELRFSRSRSGLILANAYMPISAKTRQWHRRKSNILLALNRVKASLSECQVILCADLNKQPPNKFLELQRASPLAPTHSRGNFIDGIFISSLLTPTISRIEPDDVISDHRAIVCSSKDPSLTPCKTIQICKRTAQMVTSHCANSCLTFEHFFFRFHQIIKKRSLLKKKAVRIRRRPPWKTRKSRSSQPFPGPSCG